MSNFFFCDYLFKNPSAAEASESVYMRERVKQLQIVYVYVKFQSACVVINLFILQRFILNYINAMTFNV